METIRRYAFSIRKILNMSKLIIFILGIIIIALAVLGTNSNKQTDINKVVEQMKNTQQFVIEADKEIAIELQNIEMTLSDQKMLLEKLQTNLQNIKKKK